MTAKNIDPNIGKKYHDQFIKHIHQLLFIGYSATKPRFEQSYEEPVITSIIHDAIKEYYSNDEAPHWCEGFVVVDNPRESSDERFGKHRKQPDLVIVYARKPRNRFVFEAKILGPAHTAKNYCGEDGLGCFLNSEYAAENPHGGMLGYVQSQTILDWNRKIYDEIQYHSCQNCQDPHQIISDLPFEWSSNHIRTNGSCIRMYHILLDCH